MDMVERVAKAIAKADHPADADLWDENLHGKDTYRALARAAIGAMHAWATEDKQLLMLAKVMVDYMHERDPSLPDWNAAPGYLCRQATATAKIAIDAALQQPGTVGGGG